MKTISAMSLSALTYILAIAAACSTKPDQFTNAEDSTVLFVGTTPCSNVIRPLHNIAPENDCSLNECKCLAVEWRLVLYWDEVTQKPTTYKLISVNRSAVKETNMLSEPGTKTESKGKWTIIQGTKSNQDATLYQLNPDKSEISLSFLKLSDDLLHILDHEERLMIGNEFWNYTLSRVNE